MKKPSLKTFISTNIRKAEKAFLKKPDQICYDLNYYPISEFKENIKSVHILENWDEKDVLAFTDSFSTIVFYFW